MRRRSAACISSSSRGDRHAHPMLLEKFLKQVADFLVVVDDQYVGVGFHGNPVIAGVVDFKFRLF